MKPSIRTYLCNDENHRFFGEGPRQLLHAIDETGSLRSAALSMNMAYTKALRIIRSAEATLGFPLTVRTTGGKGGGGSQMTAEAREFLAKYEAYRDACTESGKQLYEEFFCRRKSVFFSSGTQTSSFTCLQNSNDVRIACIIMASGLAGNPEITEENADYDAFVAALTAIAEHMCAEHAGDGEGATHLITCEVTHAPDLKTARAVSRSVVCSNLFKAAVFGRDANWGRILCAIGYTPGDFSIDKVCVWLSSKAGEVYVCENAAYHPYSEEEAAKVLAEHDVLVKVDMGTGDASAKAWGCDLTYDYVKINGDYRT